ncbi:MAG: winged helix-turn-helix domain-containing protein [Chloroflexota bacterium]|nr:winged helix-turn-helix domain-containing protein [Chloroflexota bacterium]
MRIYLAGNVAIESATGITSDWRAAGRQGRLAFAILAAEHLRPVSRDELAEGLWPDDPPPSRDRALTAVISKVRATLDGAGLCEIGISSQFGAYQMRLPAGAWIDIAAATESIDRAEGAVRAGRYRDAWPLAQVACHIARRPFLAGEEGTWVTRTRQDLESVLIRAHECLATIYIWNREPANAIRHARMAIELEPFRETAYGLLMGAHAAAGNRAEALRTYETCRALLAEELGVSPSDQMEARYLAVLRGE